MEHEILIIFLIYIAFVYRSVVAKLGVRTVLFVSLFVIICNLFSAQRLELGHNFKLYMSLLSIAFPKTMNYAQMRLTTTFAELVQEENFWV